MGRLRAWAKLKKLAEIADLFSKLVLAVAALAAIQFFLQQPDVTLESTAQAFLDKDVIRPQLESSLAQVPEERRADSRRIVEELITEYNTENERDLRSGRNTTSETATVAELCAKAAREVLAVFNVRCDDATLSTAGIGRGRLYERRLLLLNHSNGSPLDDDGLRSVLKSLQAGEFGRARCLLENVGNAKAISVSIRMSEGYFPAGGRANDPFSLKPGDSDIIREFETVRGVLERDPRLQFGVDWERATRPDTLNLSLFVILGVVMLVVFLAFLVNDILAST